MIKPRILKLTTNSLIDRRIINEANFFSGNGYCVDIIAAIENPVSNESYELNDNVFIHRFKNSSVPSFLKGKLPIKFIRSIQKFFFNKSGGNKIFSWDDCLVNEGLKFSPDLIISHDLSTLKAGIILKDRFNIPLIYNAHDIAFESLKARNTDDEIVKLYFEYERKLINGADLVVTVNNYIANMIRASFRYTPEIIVVDNANSLPFVEEINKGIELFQREKIETSRFNIIYSGSLEKGRNSHGKETS